MQLFRNMKRVGLHQDLSQLPSFNDEAHHRASATLWVISALTMLCCAQPVKMRRVHRDQISDHFSSKGMEVDRERGLETNPEIARTNTRAGLFRARLG